MAVNQDGFLVLVVTDSSQDRGGQLKFLAIHLVLTKVDQLGLNANVPEKTLEPR
jgi:hypothetical protein